MQHKKEEEKEEISTIPNQNSSHEEKGDSENNDGWDDFYYRDPNTGEISGPYVQNQMYEWYSIGSLPTCTEVSINGGEFRTIDELIRLYGVISPFHVEDTRSQKGYYVRNSEKHCGPFTPEQMQFCYEQGLFNDGTVIYLDGSKDFMKLGWFITKCGRRYPFGNNASSPLEDTGTDVSKFFYRVANRIVKGPFNRRQIQTIYDCKLHEKVYLMEISFGNYNFFVPLATLLRQHGCRFVTGRVYRSIDLTDATRRIYYMDEKNVVIEGPFVRSQIKCWYEREVLNKNTKLSVDLKRFITIGHLIEINGPEYDFDVRHSYHYFPDLENYDEFYYHDDSMIVKGPFVAKQLQFWHNVGHFDVGEFHFSVDQQKLFKPLSSNEEINPFSDETDDSEDDDEDLFSFRYTDTGAQMGPYVTDQMHMWYLRGWFDKDTKISKNGGCFISLSTLLCENGNLFPFGYRRRELGSAIGDLDENLNKSGDVEEEDAEEISSDSTKYKAEINTTIIEGDEGHPEFAKGNVEMPDAAMDGEFVKPQTTVAVTNLSLEEEDDVSSESPEDCAEVPTFVVVDELVHSESLKESSEIDNVSAEPLYSHSSEDLARAVSICAAQEPTLSESLEWDFTESDVPEEKVVISKPSDASLQAYVSAKEDGVITQSSKDTEMPATSIEEEINETYNLSETHDQVPQEEVVQTESPKENDEGANAADEEEVINSSEQGDGKSEISIPDRNLVSDDESLMDQVSPKATTTNWLAVSVVALLVILNEGLFFIVSNVSHTKKDKQFSECLVYSSRLMNVVYFIIAMLVVVSPSDSLKACFRK